MFIVIEGADGAGTTTQSKLLADHFRAQGREVVLTFEPTLSHVGQVARQAVTAMEDIDERSVALLFAADRIEHCERVIRPALARGAFVICDRYVMSSLVYQTLSLFGSPEAEGRFDWICQINSEAIRPDLTILLDVTPEVCLERIHERGGEVDEIETLENISMLRELYSEAYDLTYFSRRMHAISSDGDQEDVFGHILNALEF